MSDQSAVELEREADIARAKVSETAQSIRDKMTPGQLIDEFTGAFSGGDGSAALQNLKSQICDNPLPLTLVGAGLAWLMLGQGPSSNGTAAAYGRTRSPNGPSSKPRDKGLALLQAKWFRMQLGLLRPPHRMLPKWCAREQPISAIG